jgi:hypothetical protein
MDWELYERQRATLILVSVVFFSLLLFVFQRSSSVRYLRSTLVQISLPTGRLLAQMRGPAIPVMPMPPTNASTSPNPAPPSPDLALGTEAPAIEASGAMESRRRIAVLTEENRRLTQLVDLRQRRWPRALAAHVTGRDPQRWFQEVILDRGELDGIRVDFPVVAIVDGREGLVGRVIDVSPQVCKVMLIQDSLSAVAATVQSEKPQDGVVEGTNSHDLFLKFLDRGSNLKIGDPVITSGLGAAFPPGIPIGWVEEIHMDPRQLFLQARLRPAVHANRLHFVLVLTDPIASDDR